MLRPPKRPRGEEPARNEADRVGPGSAPHLDTLSTLPLELLDEIVSYFPTIPFNEIMISHLRQSPGPVMPVVYRERFDALRVLSQTSKRLRGIYFKDAWTGFEACTIRDDSEARGSFFRQLGFRLEKRCNGLLQCTHLLPLVQCVRAFWLSPPDLIPSSLSLPES